MDVYWINCFLACTLAFILGQMNAERKFKRMLANMMAARVVVAEAKEPSSDK